MMLKGRFLLYLGILFISVSCKIQEISIDNPRNLKIEELNLKNVKLKLDLPVSNPNNFSFNVKKLNLDLYVNGRNVGKLKQDEKIKIKANSKQNYPVCFDITTKETVNNVLYLVGELPKRDPKLKVKGYIKVGIFIFSKKINVDYAQSF